MLTATGLMVRFAVGISLTTLTIAEATPLLDVEKNTYVNIGTFAVSLIGCAMFFVWVARDRMAVEARLVLHTQMTAEHARRIANCERILETVNEVRSEMAAVSSKLDTLIERKAEHP